jgi:hypothetical protein
MVIYAFEVAKYTIIALEVLGALRIPMDPFNVQEVE